MRPAAYQFDVPPATAGERDWDANWLMIRGYVCTADGRQWAFLDPCLTTWEARNLSAWLRGAVGVGHAGWQAGEYVLILDIGRDDLAPAAEVWDREYEQFPER